LAARANGQRILVFDDEPSIIIAVARAHRSVTAESKRATFRMTPPRAKNGASP
jgi:hypothetical protein